MDRPTLSGSTRVARAGEPELKTVGVVLIQDSRVEQLRAPDSDGISVVVELRPRIDIQAPQATPPMPAPAPRDSGSSAAKEWISLGFNCGGAVLAWIGVVGTGALAPVTGGLSLPATGLLWGGALATSGQCAASDAGRPSIREPGSLAVGGIGLRVLRTHRRASVACQHALQSGALNPSVSTTACS